MITVTTISPEPVDPDINVRMSPTDAMYINMILRNISGAPGNPVRKVATSLSDQLDRLAPRYPLSENSRLIDQGMHVRNVT